MIELLSAPIGALLIFLLRIVDVSLATVRLLMSVRGRKLVAASLGFIEILIWITAVGTALQNMSSWMHVVAYSGGFAAGTFVGLTIEEKLAFGLAILWITSRHSGVELAEALRSMGFGVTQSTGQGREGAVQMLSTAVRRRDLRKVLKEIERWDPQAFVVVEEPKAIHRGWLFSQRRK